MEDAGRAGGALAVAGLCCTIKHCSLPLSDGLKLFHSITAVLGRLRLSILLLAVNASCRQRGAPRCEAEGWCVDHVVVASDSSAAEDEPSTAMKVRWRTVLTHTVVFCSEGWNVLACCVLPC